MRCLQSLLFILVPLLVFPQKGMQVNNGYLKINSGSIVKVGTSDGNLSTGAAGIILNKGTIIVEGSWSNVGLLNVNEGTIKCAGNYLSNGAQTETGSIVELNGTGSKDVSGSNLIFHDLRINKSSGDVNLTDNASVAGTLTLTSGDLIIATAKQLSIDDTDDPGISGGSASSHIVTSGTAVIQDAYSSTAKITYPLGDGTNYRPVSLTPSVADPETWTVSYSPTAYSDLDVAAGLNHVSTQEYWNVNRSASVNAFLELTWEAGNVVTDYSTLALAHYNGADWDLIPASTVGNNTSGVITSAAQVTSFSPFTLASSTTSNPLPIELLSFDGDYHFDENAVVLNWITASELNNDYFSVEKSSNSRDWQTVTTLNGAGNSRVTNNYQYLDKIPETGVFYYRLKQTDYNGAFKYSNAITVTVPDLLRMQDKLVVSPNPTERFVNIDIVGEGQIQVMNYTGLQIISRGINENNRMIDMQGYAKGVYLLAITTAYGVYCSQLILE